MLRRLPESAINAARPVAVRSPPGGSRTTRRTAAVPPRRRRRRRAASKKSTYARKRLPEDVPQERGDCGIQHQSEAASGTGVYLTTPTVPLAAPGEPGRGHITARTVARPPITSPPNDHRLEACAARRRRGPPAARRRPVSHSRARLDAARPASRRRARRWASSVAIRPTCGSSGGFHGRCDRRDQSMTSAWDARLASSTAEDAPLRAPQGDRIAAGLRVATFTRRPAAIPLPTDAGELRLNAPEDHSAAWVPSMRVGPRRRNWCPGRSPGRPAVGPALRNQGRAGLPSVVRHPCPASVGAALTISVLIRHGPATAVTDL